MCVEIVYVVINWFRCVRGFGFYRIISKVEFSLLCKCFLGFVYNFGEGKGRFIWKFYFCEKVNLDWIILCMFYDFI